MDRAMRPSDEEFRDSSESHSVNAGLDSGSKENIMALGHRTAGLIVGVVIVLGVALASAMAQAPRPAPAAAPAAASATHPATVLQVMRGVLFPNSNVIFAAQSDDPAKVKQEANAAMATNPLASVYGGWMAVENSGLALTEAASLLEVPRTCSTGKPAPIAAATWKKGIAELRAAGIASYEAARAKNQDQILDAAEKVSTACSTCHEVFREPMPRCVGK
jgi:hypothetical protein